MSDFADDLAALDPLSSVWSTPPALLAVGDSEDLFTVVADPTGYAVVKHARSTRYPIAHSIWLVDALRHLTCTLHRTHRSRDPWPPLVGVPDAVTITPLDHDSVLHWLVDGVEHELQVRSIDDPVLMARAAFATRDEIVASLRSLGRAPLFGEDP